MQLRRTMQFRGTQGVLRSALRAQVMTHLAPCVLRDGELFDSPEVPPASPFSFASKAPTVQRQLNLCQGQGAIRSMTLEEKELTLHRRCLECE